MFRLNKYTRKSSKLKNCSIGWLNAQSIDNKFISTYAQNKPTREDIAESFLPCLMVRYRQNDISTIDLNKITQTRPSYFDLQNFDLYTFQDTILSTNIFEE